MAKFVINEGAADEATVEAAHYSQKESLIIFYADWATRADQVYALPVDRVGRIRLVTDGK